jgi:hypothetical protein
MDESSDGFDAAGRRGVRADGGLPFKELVGPLVWALGSDGRRPDGGLVPRGVDALHMLCALSRTGT